jgi:hypothetical protein
MKTFIVGILTIFILISCGKNNVEILSINPTPINAGKPFNVQPSGLSCFIAKLKNAVPGSKFVLDGQEIATAIDSSGESGAGQVPERILSSPGSYKLYLINKDGNKSNEFDFVVK